MHDLISMMVGLGWGRWRSGGGWVGGRLGGWVVQGGGGVKLQASKFRMHASSSVRVELGWGPWGSGLVWVSEVGGYVGGGLSFKLQTPRM